MSQPCRVPVRFLQLFLVCLASLLPLRAQLNPQLVAAPTDFLDLFQQNTSTKIMPEIATVFDFSGSMRALMFHPLYPNSDLNDGDAYCPMQFSLVGATDTYTITAKSAWDTSCSTTITVTVAGGFGSSSAATHTKTGSGWSATTALTAITASPTTTPVAGGAVITFSATATESSHSGTPSPAWSSGITWTASGGTITSSGVWTAPTYNSPCQATLSGGSMWNGGSTSSLVSTTLIQPNGSPVTAATVNGTSTTLDGGGALAADVRNWIRCASHVRFTYTDGSTLRTVDIPIPWAVTSSASSGAPLTSLKVNDSVSGNQMEIDSLYSLGNGDPVFCTSAPTPYGSGTVGSSTCTTCYLAFVCYRPTYIQWLFTGKYPAGTTYAGQYIVYDAANASLAGGQGNVSWGQGYGAAAAGNQVYVPTYDGLGNYLGDVQQDASTNILPSRTRCQAVKEAAIRTWIAYQTQVIWAYRFLDPTNEAGPGVSINTNSTTFAGANPTTTVPTYGVYSGWQVMNGNSVTGMQRLAAYVPYNGTPLTAALARTYAQFCDPNSVFNAIENGTTAPVPPQCLTHFLILFTDGLDNNGTSTYPSGYSGANPSISPYLSGTTFNAATGNAAILASSTTKNYLNGGKWWNLFTFAGIAAHMADTSLGIGNYLSTSSSYPSSTTSPSSFLPFAIHSRNGVIFQRDHRIQTYTVGVSLGGYINGASAASPTSTNGPKRSLFLAAAMGNPSASSYTNVDALTPFALKVPGDPTSGPATNAICYFDGTNPTALVNSLNYAFFTAITTSNVNSTTNPNLPFVGGSLGQEIYLGQFTPPSGGGTLWSGDLLMFSTRMLNGVPTIVNNTGNPLTTLTSANAQWSAAASLSTVGWKGRNLYTRIPGNTTTPEPGLTSFTDQAPGYATISPYLLNGTGEPLVGAIPVTDAMKKTAIQWAAGGNTYGTLDGSGRPISSRSPIMGDIIDSTPAALEYNYSQVSTACAGFPHIGHVTGGNRFRLIVVGDNQGWVHGFGEVSAVTNVTDSSGNPVLDSSGNPITIATGAVDELWAFMPTDFLPYMDYLETTSNPHRFTCDGSPTIYFLDLPSTGYPNGNGVFDSNNNERAIAVFGLKKGGRSYYALNIANPFTPTLQWSLRPDEAALLPSKSFSDGVKVYPAISPTIPTAVNVPGIVANMGFSTCVPALGRVQYNGYLKDAVFLGGGYSVSQLEHNFPTYPNPPVGQSTPLGRSILALDVWSGQILAAADMTKVSATIGPIGSGLVPFEFILGSGLAQRAYFMDLYGGLWSWDQNVLNTTSPYTNYRIDSSDLGTWSGDQANKVRQVSQDSSGVSSLYTCLPAPYLVSGFPGIGYAAGQANPAAVGIVMASGDRNNPIDESAGYPLGTPAKFRLSVVFDRQDTAAWASNLTLKGTSYVITDANLKATGYPNSFSSTAGGIPATNMGDPVITPGNSAYYLAPTLAGGTADTANTKFGYFLNFPGPTVNNNPPPANFIPKAVTDPYVVSGSAFYSYFSPTNADPCSGGSGYTYTDILCSVLNPSLSAADSSCVTGNALPFSYWSGVPSNFSIYGTQGVFQGGTVAVVNPAGGSPTTQVNFSTLLASSNNAYPKIRVWRTVH